MSNNNAVSATAENPHRGIVVIDVGSTNVKALLFDAGLTLIAEEGIATTRHEGPPYLAIDMEPVVAFARQCLPAFDALLPVDVIVPCSHGSSAVLLDEAGNLALPIMSYEAEPPQSIVDGYSEIEPDFSEVFAPTNPGALTLARQFFWLETDFAAAFATVRTIMPLAQYLAYRLTGIAANEVSAMGAQTHLWAPLRRDYSELAKLRGWACRFAPLRKAWEDLGPVAGLALRGRARVLTGVHDSNANLLLYLGARPFTLLSTGTWIIGFATDIDIRALDPARDQVSNTTIFGDPIASCRFMGGREFEAVAAGASPDLADTETVIDLLSRGVAAWPSFSRSGGPLPATNGYGHIEGDIDGPKEQASLAALYCAQMSALSLQALGVTGQVIVDGPFAVNRAYLECLAACLPKCAVHASGAKQGTATGAAMLALGADGTAEMPPMNRIRPPGTLADHDGLRRWFSAVQQS